ncbi:hypothetical protein L1049_019169 [Liquidambar formosana]|uniref:FLZ-type domain-containing protein n=1 Tax=Liquidambar formosana TaxID=63359 RepID=A0AAP0RC65_LIQFO
MRTSFASSMRPGMFSYAGCEEPHQPHFLQACFLCRKPLGCNKDIFMYRGDTPFCSNECRQEQIEIDEANDRSRKMSASMRSLRKTDPKKSSPNKAVRTGTVEVA